MNIKKVSSVVMLSVLCATTVHAADVATEVVAACPLRSVATACVARVRSVATACVTNVQNATTKVLDTTYRARPYTTVAVVAATVAAVLYKKNATVRNTMRKMVGMKQETKKRTIKRTPATFRKIADGTL